jgi:bacterioferritin
MDTFALIQIDERERGNCSGYCDIMPKIIEMNGIKSTAYGSARAQLIKSLNDDLSGEYQAIISYVIYSQVLKGAEFMDIAKELEKNAAEELKHAMIISSQIDYLGSMPTEKPKPVSTSRNAREMLRSDLQNEIETIQRYRQRIRQCEALEEYAMAEHILNILVDEQEHMISLATALGIEVPVVGPDPSVLQK